MYELTVTFKASTKRLDNRGESLSSTILMTVCPPISLSSFPAPPFKKVLIYLMFLCWRLIQTKALHFRKVCIRMAWAASAQSTSHIRISYSETVQLWAALAGNTYDRKQAMSKKFSSVSAPTPPHPCCRNLIPRQHFTFQQSGLIRSLSRCQETGQLSSPRKPISGFQKYCVLRKAVLKGLERQNAQGILSPGMRIQVHSGCISTRKTAVLDVGYPKWSFSARYSNCFSVGMKIWKADLPSWSQLQCLKTG